jgi:hypothetical protein
MKVKMKTKAQISLVNKKIQMLKIKQTTIKGVITAIRMVMESIKSLKMSVNS